MRMSFIPAILITVQCACGQGTFIYDQQSTNLIEGGYRLLPGEQGVWQSFTPTLTYVGFIQLYMYDSEIFSSTEATVNVALHSGSATGPLLATSGTALITDAFAGIADFVFPTPVPVTSGSTYFFVPMLQSGNSAGGLASDFSYTVGTSSLTGRQLWFQEGVVVPEPSAAALILIGGGMLYFFRRRALTASTENTGRE